jgi:hypothetical protein
MQAKTDHATQVKLSLIGGWYNQNIGRTSQLSCLASHARSYRAAWQGGRLRPPVASPQEQGFSTPCTLERASPYPEPTIVLRVPPRGTCAPMEPQRSGRTAAHPRRLALGNPASGAQKWCAAAWCGALAPGFCTPAPARRSSWTPRVGPSVPVGEHVTPGRLGGGTTA